MRISEFLDSPAGQDLFNPNSKLSFVRTPEALDIRTHRSVTFGSEDFSKSIKDAHNAQLE